MIRLFSHSVIGDSVCVPITRMFSHHECPLCDTWDSSWACFGDKTAVFGPAAVAAVSKKNAISAGSKCAERERRRSQAPRATSEPSYVGSLSSDSAAAAAGCKNGVADIATRATQRERRRAL